jgi:hypothetical protein
MKKLILILALLFSFISYSQSSKNKTKNCECIVKTTHKKKPIKKKTVILNTVKPVTPVKSDINITINNTIINSCPCPEVKKDTLVIIKTIEKPVVVVRDTPEFEIYAGIVDSRQFNAIGYMIGANIIPNLHQIGKDGKQRQWLNRYLLGVEFSGYDTNTQYVNIPGSTSVPITKPENCNCTETTFGGFETGSSYNYKYLVRGFSINLGVEVYRGWYLTSGVTGYKRTFVFNNDKVGNERYVYLDAGIKKFIKLGNVYLSPMFKFNTEVTSFGLGFSYD